MGLPVEINNLMLGSLGGYTVGRSLRFRSSASAYLNRTPAAASNQKTWTWSSWVKRGALGALSPLIAADPNGVARAYLLFDSNDQLRFDASGVQVFNTSAVYRDPSAWYHVVFALDMTQATAANRYSLYVNGVQITSYSTDNRSTIAQNTNLAVNSVVSHNIARDTNTTTRLFDGYLAEVNFIDGQALTPSSFGAYDTNGVWQPKKYSGTYGTNGFYLPFSNTTSTTTLVQDSSGNGNNWTANNISLTAGTTYDSMIDSPTNSASSSNYAVLNPLSLGSTVTISNANLTMTEVGTYATTVSSIAMTSGKWYAEMTVGSNTYAGTVGIAKLGYASTSRLGFQANTWAYNNDGGLYYNSTTLAVVSSYTTNDVIGIAFDADNLTITFYKNNVQQGTQYTSANSGLSAGEFYFATGHINSTSNWNFGQRPFSYTPPTGFKALNTYNLPAPSISAGNKHFDALLYTANVAGGKTISGLNFQPDLVWIKNRDNVEWHYLQDVVRGFGGAGTTKGLSSNQTDAEATIGADITFEPTSNGFTITDTNYNSGPLYFNGRTYVAWNWKAGGTGVTNNSGTITSTVSANSTAGFSIVTYTGTGANATVGHGLGVAPSMIIFKRRDNTGNWAVYHTSVGNTAALYMNLTAAQSVNSVFFNNTSPTSSVFSIGTGTDLNVSGSTNVAYCFSAVAGYSAFGKYTGNGSSDGPFIYTGFRPRFLLVKDSSAAQNWRLFDSSRSTYNAVLEGLFPNLSNAESSTETGPDFLSNGFKIRTSSATHNASGNTIIYAAFAESPFQISRAR